jgi:putative hydrolase
MLEIDLHTHSFFSHCGLHTHLEILERAKALGLKAVAITDHGPELNPRFSPPFYDRLRAPVAGITLLKGMECNIKNETGDIDLPEEHLPYLDVVLLGIHPNTPKGLGRDRYTQMLLKAIEKNPAVDIITHPNDTTYPVEFAPVAEAALARGIAIELNNSKTMLSRVPPSMTEELVTVVKAVGCRLVVTSDMHAIEELGLDNSVRPYLEKLNFPLEKVVSSSAKQVWEFLEERRSLKK